MSAEGTQQDSGSFASLGSGELSIGAPSFDASISLATSDRFFADLSQVRTRVVALSFVTIGALGVQYAPFASAMILGLAALLGVLGRGKEVAHHLATLLGVAACVPVIYQVEFFGPALGAIAALLFVYNVSAPPLWGVTATLIVGVPHVAALWLITLGRIPRDSLHAALPHPAFDWSNLLSTTLLYALGPSMAWLYRARTGAHLSELAEAGQKIAAHDALLREARQERERVVSTGQRGRFTEQKLGSFVLGAILGRGGMGEIYEGTHEKTQERAAVKLLRPPGPDGLHLIRRFEREATVLNTLHSPHIVKVLEIGGLEAAFPFIAMERLEGEDLGQILRRQTRLPPLSVLRMLSEAAAGLAIAKRHNIVHRDIKPSNLFKTAAGDWKLLDFGLSRIAGASGTLTGERVLGTFGYLAPEQIAGDVEVSHQTDVHALAIVAYRALTGQMAFVERRAEAVLREVVQQLPTRPSRVADLPPEVDDVLRIALAKAPVDRFDEATEFADALADALRGELSPQLRTRAKVLNARLSWADPAKQRSGMRAAIELPPALNPSTAQTARLVPPAAHATAPTPAPVPVAAAVAADAAAEPKVSLQATLASASEDVIRYMSMARADAFSWLMVAVALYGGSQFRLNPRPEMLLFGQATVVLFSASVIAARLFSRDKSEAGFFRFHLAMTIGCFFSTGLTYYFSPFGLVPAFAAVFLTLLNIGTPPRFRALSILAIAIPHAAMILASAFGWLEDRGVLTMTASREVRLWNLAHAMAVYALCAVVSWMLHEWTRGTFTELAKTFRKLAEREALLRDARLELERAVGVGQPGRFTGHTVGASYVLGAILGRGGMGEVYEASSPSGPCAVKLVRLSAAAGPEAAARFEREGQLVRGLSSPHIVQVLDVGGTEQAIPFIAMERLNGQDLATLLQTQLLLPPGQVAELVEQIAAGLQVAHERGVVHRDLKPQNLFLAGGSTWKILDFGIAAADSAGGSRDGAAVMGTPAYMAPEQLDPSAKVELRTDVYALAAVAYRALTGRPAFSGRDAMTVVNRVLHNLPDAPSSIGDVPTAVDDVLLRAMAKRPADRFADAPSFARALRTALGLDGARPQSAA